MGEVRIAGIRRILRLPTTRRRIAREVDDEIRFHVESRIDELLRLGWSSQDARERAHAEYGDTEESRRELIDVDQRRFGRIQRKEHLMSLVDDLKYAARGLARRPALLTITVVTLTIGIAANAVMFGIVDQLLLRAPAHVAKPDLVKRIYYRDIRDGVASAHPITTYQTLPRLREQAPAFAEVSGFYRTSFTLGRGTEARDVDTEMVSGNYFQLLGVQPVAGRTLLPADDPVPNGEQVAVLSNAFWKSHLGGASDAVGRTLVLAGKPFVIVGIAPEGFSGVDRQNVDLWIPIGSMATAINGEGWHTGGGHWWLQLIGRLRSEATVAQAELQGTAAFKSLIREWKQSAWSDSTASVVLGPVVGTRAPDGMSPESKVSLWLMGVSAVVLLIACANVANLLLARTLQRRREIAVRLALGVSRMRLVRMLLAESALLAGIGAAASLLVAYWAGRVVQQTLLPGMVWSGAVVDLRVLAFTALLTIMTVIIAGVLPALQGLRTSVSAHLKESSRQLSGGRAGLRTSLVVLQAALSIVLLVGAGLFVRSLRNVNERDVGIDLDRVVRVSMSLASAGFERPQINEIYRLAQEQLSRVPGVEQVSVVRGSVPMASGNASGFTIPGVDSLPDLPGGGPYVSFVQSNFLPTLGARILSGRNFTEEEERFPARKMIISEVLARNYFGERDPVGTCVMRHRDSLCTEIIGVVENVLLFQMVKDDRAMLYLPSSMSRAMPQAILARISGDPTTTTALIRNELQRLSPNMPYVRVSTFEELVAPQLRPWRLGATMFSLMGSIALLIAVVGLYGVMAFLVSQRTHEIGVRMALGANRFDVVRLIAWQSGRAVLLGLLIGAGVALFASRFISDLLYETSTSDPIVYGVAAVVLTVAAAIASVSPARRATAIDPAQALRAD